MDLAKTIARVEALEKEVYGVVYGLAAFIPAKPVLGATAPSVPKSDSLQPSVKGNNTVTAISTIETVLSGGLEEAAAVENAVAAQTTSLGKIENAIEEFLTTAPTIVSAVDPAISAPVSGIAHVMLGLLGVLQDAHLNSVVPQAAATVANTKAAAAPPLSHS